MRWILPFASVVVAAISLSACNVKINVGSADHVETRDHDFDFPTDGALEVVTTNGAVSIKRRGGIDRVRVRAKIRATSDERLDDTVVVADHLPDGTLVISVSWPDERKSNEGCSLEIEAPDVVRVKVRSGNGAITIEDLGGPATLETSNGRIEVKHHDGPVEARTSNGSIQIDEVRGLVVGHTSNGKVRVEDAHGPVDVNTSNGRITIELAADNPGPVSAKTSNGRIEVKVGKRFAGEVSMKTSNSKVRFDDFPGLRVLERTKRTALITIPGADHVSTLVSSNGSIELERD